MQQIKSKLTASAYSLGGVNWPRLFLFYDHDGTGAINLDEFASLLRKDAKVTARMLSDEMLKHLFGAIDKDSSGKVAYREFLNWLELDDELALDAQLPPEPPSLHPVGAEAAAAAAAAYRKASAEREVGALSRGGSPSPKMLLPTGGDHSTVAALRHEEVPEHAVTPSAARVESPVVVAASGNSPHSPQPTANCEQQPEPPTNTMPEQDQTLRHVASNANAVVESPADAAGGLLADSAAGVLTKEELPSLQPQLDAAMEVPEGAGITAIETEMDGHLQSLEVEAAATERAATEIQRRMRGHLARRRTQGDLAPAAVTSTVPAVATTPASTGPASPTAKEAAVVLEAELNRTRSPTPAQPGGPPLQQGRQSPGPGRPPHAASVQASGVAENLSAAKAKAPPHAAVSRSRSNSNTSATAAVGRSRSSSVNGGGRGAPQR